MVIYKITNKLNNKVYIGQTVDYNKRMIDHFKKSSSLSHGLIDKEIACIGRNCFKHEILLNCNLSDVDLLEMYMIMHYRSYLVEFGYNVFYKSLSLNDIAGAEQVLAQIKNCSYKLDSSFESKFINRSKAVVCVSDLYRTFSSVSECARYYNLNISHVSACCLGKRATCGNMIFRFIDFSGSIIEPNYISEARSKEVYVVEVSTTFPSISSAMLSLGINTSFKSAISKCLNGERKTAAGYTWLSVIDGCIQESTFKSKRTCKKVLVVELNKSFDSVSDAIKFLGLPSTARGAISHVLNGKQKTAYGYHWIYID